MMHTEEKRMDFNKPKKSKKMEIKRNGDHKQVRGE
jgi:hypothetical protein